MIDRRAMPLNQLRQMSSLYRQLESIVDDNIDICKVLEQDEISMTIIDTSPGSHFTFSLDSPKFGNGKTNFNVTFKPSSPSAVRESGVSLLSEGIEAYLSNWIQMIREYRDIALTPSDYILRDYEKRFVVALDILDDDADVKPFEYERQVMLYELLEYSIGLLEVSKGEGKDLVLEAVDIRDGLAQWSKRKTIRRISRFLAELRMKNFSIFRTIWQKFLDESFSRLVNEGFDKLGDFV